MSTENPNFDSLESQFGEDDKIQAALGINEDVIKGLESGEIQAGDKRQTQAIEAIEELMGECHYPSYCKFYGENPSFCDRSCNVSIWDQI